MKRSPKYSALGPKLRKLREQLMLKQENVARLAKMDKSTLSRIECCRLKDIKEIHLRNLAKAYNTSIKQLLALEFHENNSSVVFADSAADQEAIIGQLEEKILALEEQCRILDRVVKNLTKENKILKIGKNHQPAAILIPYSSGARN